MDYPNCGSHAAGTRVDCERGLALRTRGAGHRWSSAVQRFARAASLNVAECAVLTYP
jgi:hypothetical protein